MIYVMAQNKVGQWRRGRRGGGGTDVRRDVRTHAFLCYTRIWRMRNKPKYNNRLSTDLTRACTAHWTLGQHCRSLGPVSMTNRQARMCNADLCTRLLKLPAAGNQTRNFKENFWSSISYFNGDTLKKWRNARASGTKKIGGVGVMRGKIVSVCHCSSILRMAT